MIKNLTLPVFLERNRISQETWGESLCEWTELVAIGTDHEAQVEHLQDVAQFFATQIQKFKRVHSVRWRVKDVEHLLEKIVRKRANGVAKYLDISVNNYYEIVTDLIGVRALHLFKDDCFNIDKDFKALWSSPIEAPIAYVREGDQDEFDERYSEHGFTREVHPAGYRSIHYLFASQPMMRKLITEVQVRTVFEEGWSEIDHNIRYPNFLNNQHVNYFLAIFNRMAGSADEMGGFVRKLAATLNESEQRLVQVTQDKIEALQEMNDAIVQLESLVKKDKKSQDMIVKLRSELSKFEIASEREVSQSSSDELLQKMGFAKQNQAITDLVKANSPLQDFVKQNQAIADLVRANSPWQDFVKQNKGITDLVKANSPLQDFVKQNQAITDLVKANSPLQDFVKRK